MSKAFKTAILLTAVCITTARAQQFEYTDDNGATYTFLINNDGATATIVEGDARGVERLVLPATVKNSGREYAVAAIAPRAFSGDMALRGVKELTLPPQLLIIDSFAFEEASDLETVNADSYLTSVAPYSFAYCSKLRRINMPADVRLATIGDKAFMNCGLTDFVITDKVSKIGTAPFAGCSSMTSLTVSDANINFFDRDGALYTADRKHLIQYAAGRPDSVMHVSYGTERIDGEAFACADRLQQVIFPASLRQIDSYAFIRCPELSDVKFNSADVTLEPYAFDKCPQLKKLEIYGSESGVGQNALPEGTRLVTTAAIPPVKLSAGKEGILTDAWRRVAALPGFETMNRGFTDNKDAGTGRSTGYGNPTPAPEVNRILSALPKQLLVKETTDESGRTQRFYIDDKHKQMLYAFIGINGNDLMVSLHEKINVKKCKKLINKL